MIALQTRIYVSKGKEYRITKGVEVHGVPKDVLEEMVRVGLVEKSKPAQTAKAVATKVEPTVVAEKVLPVKATPKVEELKEETPDKVESEGRDTHGNAD